MDPQRNLDTAVLAFQLRHIDAAQLADVCHEFGTGTGSSVVEILIQRGLITEQEKRDLEQLVEQRPLSSDDDTQPAAESDDDSDSAKSKDAFQRTIVPSDLGTVANPDGDANPHKEESPGETPKPGKGVESHFERTFVSHMDDGGKGEGPPDSDFEEGHHRVSLVETINAGDGSHQRSRYTLTRVHGEGGLGRVWLARDAALNREVALKEIRPDKDVSPGTSRRFLREAQITGQLEHPNIIPVYDLSHTEDSDEPYYTMRLMRGRTLSQEIKEYHKRRRIGEENPLDFPRLMNAFVSICNALHFANSRGVIHRDLKPDNIMIGAFGEVIVLDWGLALMVDRATDEFDAPAVAPTIEEIEKTHAGGIMGTPAYMAPEQADGRNDRIDARTDVYGLGAILFAILTGHGPHKLGNSGTTVRDTLDLLRFISVRDAPRPRDVDSSIPRALDSICRHAMARRPSERYVNAKELADDVQRFLADEPVSCHAEPWRDRSLRWLRKHKTWAQSLATALTLIAVISAAAAFFINGARRREASARVAAESAHKKELTAHEETAVAKADAVRRFQQTRQTSDRALEGVSDVLLNFPGMQRIRQELLQQLATDYQSYAEEDSSDPSLRLEAGRAMIRLATIQKLLGRYDSAESAYSAGLQRFMELKTDGADNLAIEQEIAATHNLLGSLFATMNRVDDAQSNFETAIRLMTALIAKNPEDPELKSRLLGHRANLANLQHQNGNSDSAVKTLTEIEAEFKALTTIRDLIDDRMNLAKTKTSLAQMLGTQGRIMEAEVAARSAVDAWRELTVRKADEPEYQLGLVESQLTLANTLHTLGRRREQRDVYQDAILNSEILLASQPDIPAFQEKLALSRHNYANLLHQLGENSKAEEASKLALAKFIELAGSSEVLNPGYYAEQGAASLLLGRIMRDQDNYEVAEQGFFGAIGIFQQLSEQVSSNPEFRRRLGTSRRTYAELLIIANKKAQAADLLNSAVADFKAVLSVSAADHYAADGLARAYTALAEIAASPEESKEHYRSAISARRNLQSTADHLCSYAALLANCKDAGLRDTQQALSLAKQAVALAPTDDHAWNTLAMVQFRNDDADSCLKTLDEAEPHRLRKNDTMDFLRAMALAKKNETQKAKNALVTAQERMQQNAPGNPILVLISREATSVIEPQPDKSATEKPKADADQTATPDQPPADE